MLVEHAGTVPLGDAGLPSRRCAAGALRARPFPVPPDAVGVTCGFLFTGQGAGREIRVAVATDLGHGGNGLFEEFVDSDLILIESNYDPGMLAASSRMDRTRAGSAVGD